MPFLAIALAMSAAALLGPHDATAQRKQRGMIAIVILVAAVIAAAWWFYPVWTGLPIPYNQWQMRMWMPTWI